MWLQISKHGTGRAYWSVQGKYYSTEQKFYAAGHAVAQPDPRLFQAGADHQGGKVEYNSIHCEGPVALGDTLAVSFR